MPRKKLIDEGKIKWGKIDTATIKEKNCLQAELHLQEPLTPLQAHTLQSFCKFTVGENRQQISFDIRNSWKGLIMACLSIAYCIYGRSIIYRMLRTQQYFNTKVEFDYEILLRQLKDSGTSKEPENIIERIAMPPSWKPCYVMGKYTVKEIHSSFERIKKLLVLDDLKTLVKIGQSTSFHIYKSYPVTFPQETTRWRVSDFVDCAEGIAVIKDDVMRSLSGELRVCGAPYQMNPQQLAEWSSEFEDPGKPPPLFGYEISKQSVSYLCTYFPFLKVDFINISSTSGQKIWIIFDRKHLGKWG